MTLQSIANSNQFLLNGLRKPKIFEVALSPRRQVELRSVYTGFYHFELGSIESIEVDGNAYDDDTTHLNRIADLVY